ncbi:MAG: Extracellular ligand-binding receptor, partial [Pseudonocardiales bacterium]|nr:Extracellular ligand-binding receptor [Pseudonocardiales bacterium]
MRRSKWSLLVAMPLLAVVVVACSSSSKTSSGGGGTGSAGSSGSGGGTYKIGVMIDETGLSAATYAPTSEKGITAAVNAVNAAGGVFGGAKLSIVTADTTSTPAGALSAAQSLVQQKHVFAIVPMTSVFFGAEPYLKAQGVPVIGPGIDGPEWNLPSNTNLFNTFGEFDEDLSTTAYGTFMKSQGVTTCGSIGASNIPSVTASAKGFIASCTAAGLKGSPVNTSIPYGGTDIGPIALQMKAAGVDGIELSESPNTAYALVARLKQLGVKLKVALLAIGYGSDTLSSASTAAAAQGFAFTSQGAPVELTSSPGAQKMKAVLVAGGITGAPTYAEQTAYEDVQALVAGFAAAAKSNASRTEFMTALRGVKDFDAAGVFAPAKIDFSKYGV